MRQAVAILLLLLGLAWATAAHAQIVSAIVDDIERDGTAGTTSTITGVQFGAAFSGRVIVVPMGSSSSGKPSSVTIGGVSATLTGTLGFLLASAVVPSGTSGDVVATFPALDTAFCIGAYSLSGANGAVPSATINNTSGSSGSINVSAGGNVIAYAVSAGSGSWSGITLGWDAPGMFGSGFNGSVGAFDNSGGAITGRSVSYSGGLFLVAAAFDSGSPPPPSTLHMIPLLGVGK